ncbi:uncharacterized protein LOC126264564 [Aethina tumida]|uniref:uncharacterized protein LOC126264564 n=1 Tax=Aethina tumida TaxID=116153 RepID=UPI0021496261|nr:uncharacterized protein LOC126264564 [Aethina tumida]
MANKKKFRPLLTPRYLRCKGNARLLENDLRHYNSLRKSIFEIKSIVDSGPPKYNFGRINCLESQNDYRVLIKHINENRSLIKSLKEIENRPNKYVLVDTGIIPKNEYYHKFKMKQDMKRVRENAILYNAICQIQSNYNCENLKHEWTRRYRAFVDSSRFKFTINNKPSMDERLKAWPSMSELPSLTKNKTRCLMTFKVQDGETLGHVKFELYNGITPITVEHFCNIMKIYGEQYFVNAIKPNTYIEIKNSVKIDSRKKSKVFVNEKYLLNNYRPGVLSLEFKPNSDFQKFQVSLTADKNRNTFIIPFGKVVSGFNTFVKMNGYARRIGKPLVNITVTKFKLL